MKKNIFSKSNIFPLTLFFIFANLFTLYFISQERHIYHWDVALYWAFYIQIGDLLRKAPFSALAQVIKSIRHDSYNQLAISLLMPFNFLFGKTRLIFVLSLVNIFAFPAAIAFFALNKRILSRLKGYNNNLTSCMTVFIIMTFPFFWQPIFEGFVSIAGVFVLMLIYLIYVKKPFPELKYRDVIFMGLLISLLVLIRRWYAFWSVSFYIVLFCIETSLLFIRRPFQWKNFLCFLKKISLMVSVSAASFFIIAWPLARRILRTDYSDIYSVYKFSNTTFEFFKVLWHHFGLIYMRFLY